MNEAKLTDLESQMVDPLENLIGFYSVIGRRTMEASQSGISSGVAVSANSRAQGVTSSLNVRNSDLSKNTTGVAKKNVVKKISNH